MTTYYNQDGITIYHGDARDILGRNVGKVAEAKTLITDPPWPDTTAKIPGIERARELFREFCEVIPLQVKRVAIQLGCASNPGILAPMDEFPIGDRYPFFRVCWLRYVVPAYRGRHLIGSDVAYLYGKAPRRRAGKRVVPGECIDTSNDGQQTGHPCPRKLSHVRWLIDNWADPKDVILDPFMGSGTTLLAAKMAGQSAIGIEIEERFCEMAVKRLSVRVFKSMKA